MSSEPHCDEPHDGSSSGKADIMVVYQKVPDSKFLASDPKFPEDFKDILQNKKKENIMQRPT